MKSELQLCCGTVADAWELRKQLDEVIKILENAGAEESSKAWYIAIQSALEILKE